MAINAVNNDPTVLRDFTLSLTALDGQCKADAVMQSFIDYIRMTNYDNMIGILGKIFEHFESIFFLTICIPLGPACSDTVEPLAGVAKHYKTVIISYSAEGSSFSDREKYPYFFRTIGENKQYK